jgi:SAM-dependent methyltransferase
MVMQTKSAGASDEVTPQAAPHYLRFLHLLRCPACAGELEATDEALRCKDESRKHCPPFPIVDGVPRMFVDNDWDVNRKDVTRTVQDFYMNTPFPNYEETDSVSALIQKSRKGLFARLLDDQIPINSRVLEVGCGTGQLSNFLGIAQRDVFGADMTLNSLALAERFRQGNGLTNTGFYQMNLFRPIFPAETFDLVICNGVLMVTTDDFLGFQRISSLVKQGGYIIIGLYNTYGRLATDLRRLIFRVTGKRFLWLDPYLRERGGMLDAKTDAWFADQYLHPHESKHTIGQVLRWFDAEGFEFVNSIPKPRFLEPVLNDEKLFAPNERPDRLNRAAIQAHLILTGSREGGFFTLIGRRKSWCGQRPAHPAGRSG